MMVADNSSRHTLSLLGFESTCQIFLWQRSPLPEVQARSCLNILMGALSQLPSIGTYTCFLAPERQPLLINPMIIFPLS
jgi:hypothetical protein